MSRSEKVEVVLGKAATLEKKYDWAKTTDLYKQALRVVGKRDFLKKAEIQEKVGYSFYRAARQAESINEFGDRTRQAVTNYKEATEFYAKLSEPGKTPRMLRCDAMIAYIGFRLVSEVSEKNKKLNFMKSLPNYEIET